MAMLLQLKQTTKKQLIWAQTDNQNLM
jgi:hypothetical protein